MATDFELLDAWRAGDSRSGNALFERHFSSVCRFFRSKLGDEVEDVVQRTFLACIEARDRFRGSSSFKTYLFGIARRQLQDHLRKRARCRLDPMSTMGSLAPWFPSPSTIVQHDAELQRLLDAMRALPLDQQVAVELFYWEGLSAPQLAEILEVPEGTVRSRLRRARLALHRSLALAEGDDSEAHIETSIARLSHAMMRDSDAS